MATYRPKSLDELNEVYDKAKSAEQAFQKGKSLLKEESLSIETEFPMIDTAPSDFHFDERPNLHGDQESNGEISTDIHPMSNSPLPDRKDETPKQEELIYKSEDAPIKGKELSGLMDDYVRVMTDGDDYEDDEEFEESKKDSLKRRRRAKKRTKYIEEPTDGFAANEKNPEGNEDEPENEDYAEPQLTEDKPEDEKASEFRISLPSNESEYPDFAEPKKDPEQKNEKVYSDTAKEKKKHKSVAAAVTTFILILVFVATVIVGTINMTLKVNTGLPAFQSFYFFTTSQSHPAIGIEDGDFVVCKKQTDFEDGTSVVYIDRANGTFSFGIKSETSKTKDDYGNRLYVVSGTSVKQSDVIGEIKSDIPFLGKVISAVLEHYLAVLGALVVLAILLTLVRCFVFHEKTVDTGEAKKKTKNKKTNKNKSETSVKKKNKTNDIFSDVWPEETDNDPKEDPDHEYGSEDNDS